MIEFEFKGIKIVATALVEQHGYRDAFNRERTRFQKDMTLKIQFWDFTIWGCNNLYELAFVKSTLHYFMQCYWKRTSKGESKIELTKVLHHDFDGIQHSLHLVARQKDDRHYLYIAMTENGKTLNEVYLDGQEVIMLHIAIGKAIGLLVPETKHSVNLYDADNFV